MDHKDTRDLRGTDGGAGIYRAPVESQLCLCNSPDMAGQTYFEKLRERQIIVRHFKDPKICEYVRITIGTPEAMDALVEATKEILEEERQDA